MAARWTALAVGLVMLLIVGIFVGAILRPPPISPAGTSGLIEESESGGKRIIARAGSWRAVVDLTQSRSSTVAIVLSVADAEGRPAGPAVRPTAVLNMIDMAMPSEPVALVQKGPGVWQGSGQLSMAGRWNLSVEIEGERILLPFEALPSR